MVLAFDRLLARGATGAAALSVRLVAAASVPDCRDRGRRRACIGQVDHLPPSANSRRTREMVIT